MTQNLNLQRKNFVLTVKHFFFSFSEDEAHFFSVRPMYNKNRNRLFSFVADLYPNVNTLNDKDKFVWYMSQENKEII